ncbi:uncharacterized protein G2W53_033536 [Senna tora]|uniref:Uncharacterized protein n=1 Tax=Senna tora TaxID=362788 RepID=A0A834SYH1_9FABA|nr:uncharacterized protein G2W53_033536 [Senna tora]
MDSISILAWNVRGAASVEFKWIFRDLIRQHEPNVVLLTETQVGGQKARQIISNLGYSKFHTVEPMGYAGGLWVLWNENQISLRMIEDTFQEIHASMDVNGSPIALMSFVYGSPSRDRRKILWENLVNLSTVHNLPWLVGGDFNEILSPDEKWGVRDASLTRINDFQNCIDACGLTDLGFSGLKFTWCNKRPNGQIVFERLDRKQVKKMPNEMSSSINHPALSSFDCRFPDPIEIKSALWDLKPFKAAGVDGFQLVKKALGLFLDISGLSVNESKSSIWFSPNTISNEKDFILRTLPFRCSPKPGTYLGFPLCSGTKKRDFSEIVKRIRDKVESWNAPLLSKPWRVTLIKSVSAATANYYMQALPFPMSICKEIDKIHKNFLWGSSNDRKKIHLVQLGIPHGNLFINILYQICLSRNNLVFSAKDINVNSYFRFALMKAAEFSHLTVNDNNNDVFKAPVLVSWISPPAGGGTILCAEFWAILIGLELANSAEGSKIIVESDSLAVITLINDLNTPTSHHFFLSSRIADAHAKYGISSRCGLTEFQTVPPFLSDLFWRDYFGFSHQRGAGASDMLEL